ncbi:hypothetical protein PCE1_003745 [Barthelona sp. PCE]
MKHLIDHNGVIADDIKDFFFDKSVCEEVATSDSYHMLSIIGPQSSGKSTLLNQLYDTNFQVMNSSAGRKQTTKGIWLARINESANPLYVFDCEGSDGSERADTLKFERQFAVFTLAVSDVFVINMWAHDVGRFVGSGMALLRNTFEAVLHLFRTDDNIIKTNLVFVLRDFDGQTPKENLKGQLKEEVVELWKQVLNDCDRSEFLLSFPFDSVFHSEFHFLPHKNFYAEEWKQAAVDLRLDIDALMDNTNSKTQGVMQKDLAPYITGLWEVISESKELDIPSAKQLLAEHRLTNIHSECIEILEKKLELHRSRISQNLIAEEIDSKIARIFEFVIGEYKFQGKHYIQHVFDEKYAEFISALFLKYEELTNEIFAKITDGLKTKLVQELQEVPMVNQNRYIEQRKHRSGSISTPGTPLSPYRMREVTTKDMLKKLRSELFSKLENRIQSYQVLFTWIPEDCSYDFKYHVDALGKFATIEIDSVKEELLRRLYMKKELEFKQELEEICVNSFFASSTFVNSNVSNEDVDNHLNLVYIEYDALLQKEISCRIAEYHNCTQDICVDNVLSDDLEVSLRKHVIESTVQYFKCDLVHKLQEIFNTFWYKRLNSLDLHRTFTETVDMACWLLKFVPFFEKKYGVIVAVDLDQVREDFTKSSKVIFDDWIEKRARLHSTTSLPLIYWVLFSIVFAKELRFVVIRPGLWLPMLVLLALLWLFKPLLQDKYDVLKKHVDIIAEQFQSRMFSFMKDQMRKVTDFKLNLTQTLGLTKTMPAPSSEQASKTE